MSEKAYFHMKYDGPSLTSHEMDVKDFAPALLALGELLEEVNTVLNQGKTKVSVNIKATNPGSVDAVLAVSQDLIQQAVGLFSSDEATAVVNADALVKLVLGGGGIGGVIGFIKWLKGRQISNITKIDTGDLKVELQDGEVTVRTESEMNLFTFISIRKKIESVVRTPLLKPGIDSVAFSTGEGAEQEITKDEADYFSAPEITKELIDDREIETNLTLVNISFQDDGKWRFNDGSQIFFAEITDSDFNEKVAKNQITFTKDDILRVILVRKQYIADGSIKTDYILKKVIDHRSAAIQMKLPFVT